MENKHTLKNHELYTDAVVGSKIKTGSVVVIGILDTANPEYKTAVLAQERSDVSANGATEVQQFLLGWGSGKQIIRVFQSFKPSVADLKIGDTFPANYNLVVYDSLQPFFTKKDGTPQEPRKRPNGGSTITKGGMPVYRNGELICGEPQHQLITDYDRMPAGSPALSIPTEAVNAFTK